MPEIYTDGNNTSVNPDVLGQQLWTALALFICGHENRPCKACLRLTRAQLKPIARAIKIAGRRRRHDYYLAGRAVLYLLEQAEKWSKEHPCGLQSP